MVPPNGAPNILLIIIGDVGFAAPSTFGGVIPTPTLDRIASMGLRYTQFHTTSLCSRTRAALITGHSVGFGVIGEASTGYPGYNSILTKDKATIAGSSRRTAMRPHGSVKIRGDKYWLWRAVDNEGEVLDFLIQRRREARAATKLMAKLLKKHGFAPSRVVTDRRSSPATCMTVR